MGVPALTIVAALADVLLRFAVVPAADLGECKYRCWNELRFRKSSEAFDPSFGSHDVAEPKAHIERITLREIARIHLVAYERIERGESHLIEDSQRVAFVPDENQGKAEERPREPIVGPAARRGCKFASSRIIVAGKERCERTARDHHV